MGFIRSPAFVVYWVFFALTCGNPRRRSGEPGKRNPFIDEKNCPRDRSSSGKIVFDQPKR